MNRVFFIVDSDGESVLGPYETRADAQEAWTRECDGAAATAAVLIVVECDDSRVEAAFDQIVYS